MNKWVQGGSLPDNLKRYPDELPVGSPTLPVVTDLNFHLDAEILLPSSDGSHVYQWVDRSDQKRSFFQSDTARQPQLVSGVANGRPVVRFDGSNDRFNDRITLAAKNNNEITVFAAVNPKAKGDWNYLLYQSGNYYPQLAANSKSSWSWNNQHTTWNTNGVANGRSTGWQVVAGVYGGVTKLYKSASMTGSKLFVNGTVVGVGNYKYRVNNAADHNYFFHKENNYYFSGDVGEGKT